LFLAAAGVSLFAAIAGLDLGNGATGAPEDKVAVPGFKGRFKTAALLRASRRAYDGAPPVIPHKPLGAACVSCHTGSGIEVAGVGFAPPSPHAATPGMSAMARCQQCHVFRQTDGLFSDSGFTGLRQDLRPGRRLNSFAPPVIPHKIFMRENCLACHSGPAAREEIRTSHPERIRCQQCHVAAVTDGMFERP
jgi:hypothetical protein